MQYCIAGAVALVKYGYRNETALLHVKHSIRVTLSRIIQAKELPDSISPEFEVLTLEADSQQYSNIIGSLI